MTFSGNLENTPDAKRINVEIRTNTLPTNGTRAIRSVAVRENYVCLGPAPLGVKIDSLWLMARHLKAKSSVPCVHGFDCIKITFPLCLSKDMFLNWSVASEDSDTEVESVALYKRRTQTPSDWLQRNRQNWKIRWEWRMGGLASSLL